MKMEKINASLANVSLSAFCRDADNKDVKLFTPHDFRLYKDGRLYSPLNARPGCFVVVREEVVNFINNYNQSGIIAYDKYAKVEHYFNPGMVPDKCAYEVPHRIYVGKLNGSSDGIRMPSGWLIVPINNCEPSEHDPVGCFMREYTAACKTRNRNREWIYTSAKLTSFDYI